MNSPNYIVRRATTDDIADLLALWQSAQLPVNGLDKRFTEFQIVIDPTGKLLGAIGLQVEGAEGKIHSEAYADFGMTDQLRPLLWERLEKVAANRGLFRLWTEEFAPFWKKVCGFILPAGEALARFPLQFGNSDSSWSVLQLKEDRAAPGALEAEFARFKAEEGARSRKMYEQARLFKGIALALSILLFVLVAIGMIYLFRYRSNLQGHP